ncbi:MAG: trypsin-like peptidase domain-containing protein [Kiritimatiellae bacterium]|nr:trypsin-like peptidase domain-containing protein [Kiritimatiellia bacterium]MDD5523211.1 trypsin-like peptidase domain-containing protein [Kiritimatiellia bacterium]
MVHYRLGANHSIFWSAFLAGLFLFAPMIGAREESGLGNFDFREIIRKSKEKVFPAVVYVKCVRQSHESGKKQSHEVSGSGVLITSEGEILTNWHVVDKATEVRCLLHDGRAFHADIRGTDKDLDVALLRLRMQPDEKVVPYAELGDSSVLKEGDFVMAMGAPWGLVRSVSIGIISCTKRYLEKQSEYSLWLQTDASISPGNSGGPLVNTDGKIVGINTLGTFFGGDMGFSVPSFTIREILPRLQQTGDIAWSWTGLELQAIRDFNRNMYFDFTNGVLVASTDAGSPARHADIKDMDRITSINGETVNAINAEDLPAIRRKLALLPFGQKSKIEIARGDKMLTVELAPRKKGKIEGEELDCPRWDFTVKAINQFDNKALYYYRKEGVFIFGIKYPGNASNARLMQQDIIIEIDGEQVNTLEDVKRLHRKSIENISTRPRVTLNVLRNGMLQQVILNFSRDFERE